MTYYSKDIPENLLCTESYKS
uniref:Uncharacterized protein n=1 Tax=Anguilla anguilla TaxID=7936 RepID=A0A0E9VUZ7_ANGAN